MLTKALSEMPAGQRCAGKAIVVFFALMAGFAILSRGLDAFTVARVTAGAPSRGALTHEITLNGNAEPLGENAVALPEGFVVKELLLREGARIAAGDAVAVLDTAQIERLLADARRELSASQLDIAARNVKAEVPKKDTLTGAALALERAREDAIAAEEAASHAVYRATDEHRRAREARKDLRDSGDYTDEQLDAAGQAVRAAAAALEDARLARERAVTEGERAILDAQNALLEAERAAAEQDLTDAADEETKRLETGRAYLGVAALQARIAELEALLEQGGRVTAGAAGLVTALHIKPGDMTTAGGAYLLAGQATGSVFTALAPKEDAER
ncbi:MAG: hypothetical protein LBU86_02110, partial [Oscillospiraceae bacterium]|nr:hypothetical protein [Oscillospiraceae bacterium]